MKQAKCSVTEHRHQAVKLFNSPSQTILHIRESEGGGTGGYSWVPLARIECYKDQQVTHTEQDRELKSRRAAPFAIEAVI